METNELKSPANPVRPYKIALGFLSFFALLIAAEFVFITYLERSNYKMLIKESSTTNQPEVVNNQNSNKTVIDGKKIIVENSDFAVLEESDSETEGSSELSFYNKDTQSELSLSDSGILKEELKLLSSDDGSYVVISWGSDVVRDAVIVDVDSQELLAERFTYSLSEPIFYESYLLFNRPTENERMQNEAVDPGTNGDIVAMEIATSDFITLVRVDKNKFYELEEVNGELLVYSESRISETIPTPVKTAKSLDLSYLSE